MPPRRPPVAPAAPPAHAPAGLPRAARVGKAEQPPPPPRVSTLAALDGGPPRRAPPAGDALPRAGPLVVVLVRRGRVAPRDGEAAHQSSDGGVAACAGAAFAGAAFAAAGRAFDACDQSSLPPPALPPDRATFDTLAVA